MAKSAYTAEIEKSKPRKSSPVKKTQPIQINNSRLETKNVVRRRKLLTGNKNLNSIGMMMTNECTHACYYCPLRFDTIGHLKTHVMVSHSEKLAVCALCDLKMVDMDGMKEQIRLSHKINEVDGKDCEMCDFCMMKFPSPDDLRNHIQTIHKARVFFSP